MGDEPTLLDIYESIANRLDAAQTRALMGETEEAIGLIRGARLEYLRYRDVLGDLGRRPELAAAFAAVSGLPRCAVSAEPAMARMAARRPARRAA